MTSEQKKELEERMSFYSKREAYFSKEGKDDLALLHRDRMREIEEVLEVLGYRVHESGMRIGTASNGEFHYHLYTITG